MTWLRRILFVIGWGLVVMSGWMKGGNDAGPTVLLALLIGGCLILVAATSVRQRQNG